jgi:YYY domain-containing protein
LVGQVETPLVEPQPKPIKGDWKTSLLLVLILLFGAYFRFTGLNWDDGQHQHPDERYISMVIGQINEVDGVAQYFDTANSVLNPLRFGSYTYGMFPLFFTRMVAEWLGMTDYDTVTLVGRAMSGVFDLLAVWMLYILAKYLYDRRVAFLAAALGAAAVLPIQLSHYFTVDSFSTVFVVAGFYFALRAVPVHRAGERISWSNLVHFGLFGFSIGLAGACKVNTLPVFGIIALAAIARLLIDWKQEGFSTTLKVVVLGFFLSVLGAVLSFRIFQPYAFSGPGFWGMALNENWLQVIREVVSHVAGNSDWPPNTHWTDRPASYAWVNMVVWGMGIPLGLTAWLGWAWAFKRIWDGDWSRHFLPLIWVGGYFIWQNAQFWRYMRYFVPIYPFLVLFASWALVEIYDRTRESRERWRAVGFKSIFQSSHWKGALGLLIPVLVLVATYAYAFAFTRIYNLPMTRIAASEWILENIPGPFNVIVQTPAGSRSYPVAVGNRQIVGVGEMASANIHVEQYGTVSQVTATDIRQIGMSFYFSLTRDPEKSDIMTEGRLAIPDDAQGDSQVISFGDIDLNAGETYYFNYRIQSSSEFSFSDLVLAHVDESLPNLPVDLNMQSQSGILEGTLPLTPQQPLKLNRLRINGFQQFFIPTETELKVSIYKDGGDSPLAESTQTLSFTEPGLRLSPTFDMSSIELLGGQSYQVRYEILAGAPLRIYGEAIALETSWDDALPLNVKRYDAQGGIYSPLNLELYEPDVPEKRESMIRILDETEYIIIPSNRAYDAMPRLPMRYPMTLKYYQALFDCDCMGDELENKAYGLQPPFKSPLGFELIAVFESPPTLGFISFPDQWADESFTVYDHPKVMIFKKTADFSTEKVSALLNEVNLDEVFFQTPLEYTRAPTAMRLPADRLEAQRNSGDWSAVFDRNAFLNVNQFAGGLVWYLFIFLLGVAIFPLVFLVFSWLPDRGYPLMRMAGLVTVAWLAWILGSFKILTFSQLTIWLCIGLVMALSAVAAYFQRRPLVEYFTSQWKHILWIEGIFLVLFLFSLFIRLGNPDLWHPWLGGEKPMDLTFFNATLRAVYFPPEHPWFAGHYVNYYYYGYILAAIPTKLLGILPAIAYNLILPTWFAMTGAGVFSVAYNLIVGLRPAGDLQTANPRGVFFQRNLPYFTAVFALIVVLLFGNLYQVVLMWRFLPEASSSGLQQDAPFGKHLGAVIGGAIRVMGEEVMLPGNNGRWYFEASRPILNQGPDTPIAEFPYFTFLYGDLHPHMLVMPVYGLVLGWVLNLLLSKSLRFKWVERIPGLIAAGLVFGIFRAAHTWDFPTFIGLGVLAITWNAWQTREESIRRFLRNVLLYAALFAGIAILFYMPFSQWFKTEYVSLELWKGRRTPLVDYFYAFGLPLFLMLSLLLRELLPDLWVVITHWFSDVRARLLNVFKWSYLPVYLALLVIPYLLIALWLYDYQVLTFGIPLLIGIAYLVLVKRGLSLLQKVMWILFGVGLAITLFVDVFVLKGDAGRSNTVFRFYLQAWFLFGIAFSLALVEVLGFIQRWQPTARFVWSFAFGVLVLCAAAYPLTATEKKMTDRWPEIQNPPHSLDGSAFMLGDVVSLNPAIYYDDNRPINLSRDSAAIQFMQDEIDGSPVFVEGHTPEYRWGSRFAIHTGLPSVAGWSWHVRQHNSLLDGAIVERLIADVDGFYNTTDAQSARQFLDRHDVRYVVLGDLERAYYDPNGLPKFQKMVESGMLRIVFGDGTAATTTIFEVVR